MHIFTQTGMVHDESCPSLVHDLQGFKVAIFGFQTVFFALSLNFTFTESCCCGVSNVCKRRFAHVGDFAAVGFSESEIQGRYKAMKYFCQFHTMETMYLSWEFIRIMKTQLIMQICFLITSI